MFFKILAILCLLATIAMAGVVLFAVAKVGRVPMGKLIRTLIPWFIFLLLALAILTIFPGISTLIPSMMNLGASA